MLALGEFPTLWVRGSDVWSSDETDGKGASAGDVARREHRSVAFVAGWGWEESRRTCDEDSAGRWVELVMIALWTNG